MIYDSQINNFIPIPHIVSYLISQTGPVRTAPAIPQDNPTTLLAASTGAATVACAARKKAVPATGVATNDTPSVATPITA